MTRADLQPQACEFCTEFTMPEASTFRRLYGCRIEHRHLYDDGRFVVMPAIGQILAKWLLVMPKYHVERTSLLTRSEILHLGCVVDKARSALSGFGRPVVFEHGASSVSGSGCGIFHAHVHVVALPSSVSPRQLSPDVLLEDSGSGYVETMVGLSEAEEYLVYMNDEGLIYTAGAGLDRGTVPSQYLRQRLSALFAPERPWDWRRYGQEDDLLSTLRSVELGRLETEPRLAGAWHDADLSEEMVTLC